MAQALTVTPNGIGPNGARLFIVPSRSNPDLPHSVAFINGNVSCDCDSAFYRGRCPHQKAVESYLLVEQRAKYIAAVDPAKVAILQSLGIMAKSA